MTTASRALFGEVVRAAEIDVALACLLIGCEVTPDLDVNSSLAMLDDLAGTVRLPVRSPAQAAAALHEALGVEAGFAGAAADYDDVRSSLLHEVLRRRRGLPILLSVIWCEVASRLGVPATCLGQPGHVLVCLGSPTGEHVVVDPFHGGVTRSAEAAPVLSGSELLLRVLTNLRALTARQARSLDATRTRLWATELALMLPHHPADLRRERGELLVRLGDHLGGADELDLYAAAVEDVDETLAETVRRSARLARSRLN